MAKGEVKVGRLIPDLYVLDTSEVKTIGDIVLLLGNMNITTHEGTPGFDEINHLFKKV
ncbi:hypothetical protein D3C78_1922390 [compost metagenome]